VSLTELQKLPKSAMEAIHNGETWYFTNKPCKHGHLAKRLTASSSCYACSLLNAVSYRKKNPEKIAAGKKAWALANPEKVKASSEKQQKRPEVKAKAKERLHNHNKVHGKASRLLTKYGITLDEYLSMLETQRSICAICTTAFNTNTPDLKPCVDHNHSTGKVRELICGPCNRLLGNCKESPQILRQAIQYLRRHAVAS
jgi:hypothetical protein